MADYSDEKKSEGRHELRLKTRGLAEISGVTEVKSFDGRFVTLMTDCGEMTLEGENLRVGTLDLGRGALEVTGRVDALYYSDGEKEKKSARRKWFY